MNTTSISPMSGNLLYPTIPSGTNPSPLSSSIAASRKTPESFLGDKFSNLVNLDQLVTEPKSNYSSSFFKFQLYHLFSYKSVRFKSTTTYSKSIYKCYKSTNTRSISFIKQCSFYKWLIITTSSHPFVLQ